MVVRFAILRLYGEGFGFGNPSLNLNYSMMILTPNVATLALGLRPRQGGYKVVGQEGAWESLHMLLGVQKSEGK